MEVPFLSPLMSVAAVQASGKRMRRQVSFGTQYLIEYSGHKFLSHEDGTQAMSFLSQM